MFCHCDSHSLQEKILREFVLTHGDRNHEEEIWITNSNAYTTATDAAGDT
jgi:hypothetical protein